MLLYSLSLPLPMSARRMVLPPASRRPLQRPCREQRPALLRAGEQIKLERGEVAGRGGETPGECDKVADEHHLLRNGSKHPATA